MRKDRFIKERNHDPYEQDRKYSEQTFCPQCHATYVGGRWVWGREGQPAGDTQLCPACRRQEDKYPAGEVNITGTYIKGHRDEILNLIQNIADEQQQRSPLKRIIEIREDEDGLCVFLTDNHLARRIGNSMYRAYRGDLKLQYTQEAQYVRLYWHRDI